VLISSDTSPSDSEPVARSAGVADGFGIVQKKEKGLMLQRHQLAALHTTQSPVSIPLVTHQAHPRQTRSAYRY
jgi:hypothetical protein